MTIEVSTGPYLITGNLNPQQNSEPEFGASLSNAGDGIPDVRKLYTMVGDAPGYGPTQKVYGYSNHVYLCLVDAVPQQINTSLIVAAQSAPVVPVGGTLALTCTTTAGAGRAVNIPLVPTGQSYVAANVKTVTAIDFGYTIATGGTAGTKTVTIPTGAFRYFTPGQKILIANAGTSATTPLVTTVVSAAGTTLTIADNIGTTITASPIGNADPSGISAWPYRPGGPLATSITALADPTQSIARALAVTTGSANAGNATYTVRINGWDIDGYPMTEDITPSASAATVNGKKAFKYIDTTRVQLIKAGGGTFTGTISVGTTDILGLNVRSDYWEYMNLFYNGAFVSVNTGWVAADATSPATATTGCVRGTYALQSASDGVKRAAFFMSLPQYNLLNATNLNSTSLNGVAQFAA